MALRNKLSLLDVAEQEEGEDESDGEGDVDGNEINRNNLEEKYSTPRETEAAAAAAVGGEGTKQGGASMLPARPSTFPSSSQRLRQPQPQQQQQQQQPRAEQSQPSSLSKNVNAANSNNNNYYHHNNTNESHHQAGILASGLAWVDRQREKRRRQYLQMQAEQQLQKINQAAAAAVVAITPHDNQKMVSKSGEGATCRLDLSDIALLNNNNNNSNSSNAGNNRNINNNNNNNNNTYNHDNSTQKSGDDSIYYDANDDDDDDSDYNYNNDNVGGNYIYTGEDYYDATLDAAAAAPNNNNTNFSRNEKKNAKKTSTTSNNGNNKSIATGPVFSTDNNGVVVDDDDDDDDDDEFPIPPVRVEKVAGDDDPNNAFILTSEQMHEIACHVLPKTVAFSRWRRLYGLGRDGDSFDGCLRMIGNTSKTLMVVRTSKGSIFGGYAESPWHSQAQHGDARFFGSAAACLWSFSSSSSSSNRNPSSGRVGGGSGNDKNGKTKTIQVYKWTGKNRYIQLCDMSHKMIAFGGGGDDGAFGLCVQEDFQRGSTGPCDTFDNQPLCPEDNFDIVDVEFWEFMTGVF